MRARHSSIPASSWLENEKVQKAVKLSLLLNWMNGWIVVVV